MKPTSIVEIQEIIRSNNHVQARGGGSKTALSKSREGIHLIDITGLTGVQEYQPEEYTLTALAGTRISEVEKLLAGQDQYLPFDPLLVESGATLGGTLASGLSGPGRYRYGGLRDFILGVKFLDGHGNLVTGGGQVVKNAAGFDLPKLLIGSLGMYGILVEVTFKVFPRPRATNTLGFEYAGLVDALAAIEALSLSPLEIYALDATIESQKIILWVRLGGTPDMLAGRVSRLQDILKRSAARDLAGDDDEGYWQQVREFSWVPGGQALVKIPVTPAKVPALDGKLAVRNAVRRYSVGANLAWVAWADPLEVLDGILQEQGLSGLVILGACDQPQLGTYSSASFALRIKRALDPAGKFVGGERWTKVA